MATSRRRPRDFRIAYAHDPENRETVFGLSAALELSGDPRGARAMRDMAGHLDQLTSLTQRAASPGARKDPGLLRKLAAACAALDRNAEARAWYKLVIALDPLDSDAQQALFRLNQGVQDKNAGGSS